MRAAAIKSFFADIGKKKAPVDAGAVVQLETEVTNMNLQEAMPLDNPTATVSSASSRRPLNLGNGLMTVTPEIAERILAECNFEGQRVIDKRTAAALALEMKLGIFTEGMQLHFARLNGRVILVDGQHRLTGVIRAGEAVKFNIWITDADTTEEVEALYYRHDLVSRKRSVGDGLRAIHIDERQNLSPTQAQRVIAAVKVIEGGIATPNQGRRSAEMMVMDRVLDKAKSWWPAARMFYDAISGAPAKNCLGLQRKEILAVALMTCRYQPERAPDFWGPAAHDDGLRKFDPRKQLLKFVEDIRGFDGGNNGAVRAAALCWNAWGEGKPIQVLRAGGDAPIVINGTPIGKRKK